MLKAGLTNSDLTKSQSDQNVNLGYAQTIEWLPQQDTRFFIKLDRSQSTEGNFWSSRDFSIATGIKLAMQTERNSSKRKIYPKGKYKVKFLNQMVLALVRENLKIVQMALLELRDMRI